MFQQEARQLFEYQRETVSLRTFFLKLLNLLNLMSSLKLNTQMY